MGVRLRPSQAINKGDEAVKVLAGVESRCRKSSFGR